MAASAWEDVLNCVRVRVHAVPHIHASCPITEVPENYELNAMRRKGMPEQLNGKKVAILVTKGFEQVELTEPRKALEEAGARTDVVPPKRTG